MSITPQNQPQTSISLLSPTKSMVARGKQWYPRTSIDASFKFLDYQLTIMGLTAQNMPQTSISLLSPTKSMVARGKQWYPRTSIDAHLKF